MLKKSIVHCPEQKSIDTFDDAYYYLMSGFAVVVVEDCRQALAFGVQGWNKRTTDEPSNENNVKGARECFVESVNDNKALLRKRLKTYHLKQKQINLGTSAKTPVIICYIDDRADKGLVSQIEKRLKQEHFNSVLDYGELLPFIDTDISSLFSCVGTTADNCWKFLSSFCSFCYLAITASLMTDIFCTVWLSPYPAAGFNRMNFSGVSSGFIF